MLIYQFESFYGNRALILSDNLKGKNMDNLQKWFDELLFESIDEVLSSLGEPVKNYLYFRLENDVGIKKREIPEGIDEFLKVLHRIYGLGASRLEIKFMEKLYSKLKVNFESHEHNWSKWKENDVSFIGYIEKMRQNFITSRYLKEERPEIL